MGVRHVILAVAYQPQAMKEALTKLEDKYSIRISCSVEDQPMFTAGPIRIAQALLMEDEPDEENPDLFFVFNSDIITEYPLDAMLQTHLKHKKEGTICLTQVKDPSMYGVVLTRPSDGLVTCFREKPQEWVGDTINAGIYLFTRKVIDRIELRPVSIEKEIFPAMAQDQELYSYKHEGYWADIGKPRDFLDGTHLYLKALRASEELQEKSDSNEGVETAPTLDFEADADKQALSLGPNIIGNVLIHPSVEIGEDCVIGPDVTIDENCKIGRGCRISSTAIMANVRVHNYVKIDSAIIGWNCVVGKWVRVDGLTVLGQDINIAPELYINGAFILPYKCITASVTESGKIIL